MLLPVDEVHVQWVSLACDEAAVERLAATLSPDERARAARYRRTADGARFTVARGSLRQILASYLGIGPDEVAFDRGPHGKPKLALDPSGAARPDALPNALRFNLSHAGDAAVIAVALGREVGVDVEHIDDAVRHDEIASSFFSPAEQRAFAALPSAECGAAFFRCWTRKEAYVKATGEGLGRSLGSFDVTLAPDEPPRVVEDRSPPTGEPRRWRLYDLAPPPGFTASLAVEARGDETLRLRRWPDPPADAWTSLP